MGEMDSSDEAAAIRGEIRVERQLTGSRRVVRFAVGRQHGKDWRLDKYLHAVLPTISRGLLRRWIAQGCCTVDGVVAGERDKLRPGSAVLLDAPLPPPAEADVPPPLNILHEDPVFLVVNKPAGLLAHQAGRHLTGTLLNQLQDWVAERGGDPMRVRLVNRIDRDTSGLVLVSRELTAHNQLAEALDSRRLAKEYRAICHGVPEPEAGSWLDPILEGGEESIAMRIDPRGKASHTDYRVAEASPGGRFALLTIDLRTGRQHQIRIHAAHHGHPLVGDWVYGEPCSELPGQALHAARLAFPHPSDGRPIVVEAPLTPALGALWDHLKAGGGVTQVPHSEDQRSRLGREVDRGPRLPPWLSAEEFARLQAEHDR